MPNGSTSRRIAIARGLALAVAATCGNAHSQAAAAHPQRRWYEAAAEMKRLAESRGDQAYGAVLVLAGDIVGEGPSAVITKNDATAHAEREAIREARRKLGRHVLAGAVLYSTSRPCSACEAAAAEAGISRMYFGPSLTDAGVPGSGSR